ncbi:polysaccharide deacetylase family protein [Rossellomorea marisflavi]|uniref:polysaccharide deacetylase family protein n=1 Tax=Rossellomorea marisflavi TaxID=189381 RepID=UPI0035124E11
MARRRRLNRRGKIAVGLLVALTAALFFFLGGNDKGEEQKPVKLASAGMVQEIPSLEKRDLYLTFDDGPSEGSERLLDLLNEFNMKATFFMLGPHMEDYSDVVKRMKEEGFGLALHGTSHQTKDIYSGPLAPLHEMVEAQAILEKQTGVRSSLIRLPYGSVPYLTVEMRGVPYLGLGHR